MTLQWLSSVPLRHQNLNLIICPLTQMSAEVEFPFEKFFAFPAYGCLCGVQVDVTTDQTDHECTPVAGGQDHVGSGEGIIAGHGRRSTGRVVIWKK